MSWSSDSRQQPLPLARAAALWDRLEAIIAQTGQPSEAPLARQEACPLVQALLYRALTSAAGDALPAWAPATPDLQATLARWRECGAFAQLPIALRIQLDDDPQPVGECLVTGAPGSGAKQRRADSHGAALGASTKQPHGPVASQCSRGLARRDRREPLQPIRGVRA